MSRYISLLVALAVASNAGAKCAYAPDVQAEVAVNSCESVTFGASASAITWFDPNGTPLYREGSTFSGTFLAVTVKKSRLVGEGDNHGFHSWPAGEQRSLFVAAPVNSTCPAKLPAILKVVSADICCDVFPLHDECLVPNSVIRVKLVSP